MRERHHSRGRKTVDNGQTWSGREIVSYRSGKRDGMPVALFLEDTGEIVGDFDGVYDADGKTISNLSINRSSNIITYLFSMW